MWNDLGSHNQEVSSGHGDRCVLGEDATAGHSKGKAHQGCDRQSSEETITTKVKSDLRPLQCPLHTYSIADFEAFRPVAVFVEPSPVSGLGPVPVITVKFLVVW